MKLSENFTLEELLATSTGLENIPDTLQIENLKALVENLLQPLRDAYKGVITVTSGFRSHEVNARVGGVAASQHTTGEAADITCKNNAAIFSIIRNTLVFDQLIWEKGTRRQPAWVHVSFRKSGNRGQVLRFDGKKYVKF